MTDQPQGKDPDKAQVEVNDADKVEVATDAGNAADDDQADQADKADSDS